METASNLPARAVAAVQAEEAVSISDRGFYDAPSGRRVDLREALRAAADGTRDYPPEVRLPDRGPNRGETRIAVAAESTLAAARQQAGGERQRSTSPPPPIPAAAS